MNYNEFSEKIKSKYPQYKDIDNLVLAQKMIEKYPEYGEQVTFDIPKQKQGIDLTPSGLIDNTANAIASAIETPYRMVRYKQNPIDAYKSNFAQGQDIQKQIRIEHPILTGVSNFSTDLLGYSYLPVARGANIVGNFAKNAMIQGGIPMASESLKRGDNALGGFAGGTAIGATIQGLVPPALKGVPAIIKNPKVQNGVARTLEFLTSIPKKFTRRAIDAELSGNSILNKNFNPETAYQGVERKLRTAKGMLPTKKQFTEQYRALGQKVREKLQKVLKPESYYDTNLANLGQKAEMGWNTLVNNAYNDIIEALGKLDDQLAGTNTIQQEVDSIINGFGKGGVYNSALEEAPQVVDYIYNNLGKEGITLRDLHRIKERLYDMGYQAAGLRDGTAASVARGTAKRINNYLRSMSPDYIKPNDTYSALMQLKREIGGDITQKNIAQKLKDYGSSTQILSGLDKQIKAFDDLLPDESKILQDVVNINNARLAQKTLQDNIPEAILNDISRYEKAPISVQNALEQFAPNEMAAYRELLDRQTTQNNVLQPIMNKQYERNPKIILNRNDVGMDEALNYLQENTGINFMNELEDIRANDALNQLFPGQGGGSGSGQGFGNLLRTAIIGGAPTAAAITHNPVSLLGLAAISPKLMGQGTIKNFARIPKAADTLMPLAERLLTPITDIGISQMLLKGGVSN